MATAASPHAPQAPVEPSSPKLLLPAVLLCFFLGTLGIHRFYVGKIGTGVLMIVTLGGLGVWVLVDFIMLLIGSFRDKQGLKLTQWT
ncbi:TM2 domain-containing protein [Paraoerskovia marina]|uniref:TM2 domain-containing protein n=1 Tax=Paraoerskovia marina TaxID=545619 RepID=A0A1H1USL5_9CELL|nr:TM2 domain-containing protein [Paraoerskovia marina]SDS75251.1 TM2 domain-containing protein [Paraoerskovia marina]